jgi:hypothetical protein
MKTFKETLDWCQFNGFREIVLQAPTDQDVDPFLVEVHGPKGAEGCIRQSGTIELKDTWCQAGLLDLETPKDWDTARDYTALVVTDTKHSIVEAEALVGTASEPDSSGSIQFMGGDWYEHPAVCILSIL